MCSCTPFGSVMADCWPSCSTTQKAVLGALGDKLPVVLLERHADAFAGETIAHGLGKTALPLWLRPQIRGDGRAQADVDVPGAEEVGGLDGGDFHCFFLPKLLRLHL